MTGGHDFAYAQARMQARHAEQPDDALWQRLHTSRDLGHFLEAARGTGLRRWLGHVTERTEVHAVERGLRRELREHVQEVASWVPSGWAQAVRFTARLVDLPVLERLLGREPPPPWVRDDVELARFALEERDARREAMQAAGLGPIVEAALQGRTAREGWLERWRELLPRRLGGGVAELREMAERVAAHVDRMAGSRELDGWEARAGLERDLARAFRWRAMRPVAVWAHLGLTALELERLRGALLRRRLFPDVRSEVAWV